MSCLHPRLRRVINTEQRRPIIRIAKRRQIEFWRGNWTIAHRGHTGQVSILGDDGQRESTMSSMTHSRGPFCLSLGVTSQDSQVVNYVPIGLPLVVVRGNWIERHDDVHAPHGMANNRRFRINLNARWITITIMIKRKKLWCLLAICDQAEQVNCVPRRLGEPERDIKRDTR